MGLLDRIKSLNFRSREKQLNVSEVNSSFGLGMSFLSQGPQDKLLKVLHNSGIDDYDKSNPRDKIVLSRTMYDVFPFAKRAINDMSSMVGNIELTADPDSGISEELLESLQEQLSRLPILSEFDWEKPHESGIDSLVFRLVRTMLLDGMVFEQDRYEDGDLTKYQGALLFESTNFDFEKTSVDPYRLRYLAAQFPDEDPLYNITFNQIGYDYSNRFPWARPLLAGGGFFSHVLTSMLIAVKNVNTRKGAPVEMGLIGLKDNSHLSNPATKAMYIKNLEDLKGDTLKAAKKQLEGVPSNIISSLPMDVNFLNKSFGSDALTEVDHELLKLVLVAFASILEIPIEFLGIVIGGSGFSPERFKILYKIWGTKIDNIRSKIRPIIEKIIANYLRSINVNPAILDKINVEFANAEIRDENELKELDKLEAETNKTHMEVALQLAQVDLDASKEYMIKYNLLNE